MESDFVLKLRVKFNERGQQHPNTAGESGSFHATGRNFVRPSDSTLLMKLTSLRIWVKQSHAARFTNLFSPLTLCCHLSLCKCFDTNISTSSSLETCFKCVREQNQFFFNSFTLWVFSGQLSERSLPKYGLSEQIQLNHCLSALVLCVLLDVKCVLIFSDGSQLSLFARFCY